MSRTKNDRDRVSSHDKKHQDEVYYFHRQYGVAANEVRRVITELETKAGHNIYSRKKIMAELKKQGLIKTEENA